MAWRWWLRRCATALYLLNVGSRIFQVYGFYLNVGHVVYVEL